MLLRGMGVRQVCLIGVNYNWLILPSGAPGDISVGSPQEGGAHQDKPATSRSPRIQDVPRTPPKVMMKKQINSLRSKVCRMAKNIKKLKTRPNTIKGDIEMLSSKLDSLLLTKTAQFVKKTDKTLQQEIKKHGGGPQMTRCWPFQYFTTAVKHIKCWIGYWPCQVRAHSK